MPEGFHPAPPEATQGVRREDVPAEIREYAENYERQLDEIVARYGIASFRAAMKIPNDERHARLEAVMPIADLERYAELIANYKMAVRMNQIPRAERLRERRKLESRVAESVHEAVLVMGDEYVFGPDRVAATFGLDPETMEISEVPFSRAELKRAAELDQSLIMYVSKAADGEPLSMRKMSEVVSPRFAAEKKGMVFHPSKTKWCKDDPFFTNETPVAGWALISCGAVEDTENKNFLQQTKELIRHLSQDVFRGAELPRKYVEAIAEFDAAKASIAAMFDENEMEAAERLEALKITALLRQTPVEAAYDELLAYDKYGTRDFPDYITWTSRRSKDGNFVLVNSSPDHISVTNGWTPGMSAPSLGAVFARR